MSKGTHFIGQPMYGQLLNLLDRQKILRISRENGGERYVKHFDAWQHLVVMLYAVIKRFDSLREITDSMFPEADDKCCGVASPKLVTSRDAYFVSMTIYGLEDITSSKPITFRIYDADQGVVLGNVMTTLNGNPLNLTYKPNDLIGNYDTPVKWEPSDQVDQLCKFRTGWNWISLYVQPEEGKADLESIFGHADRKSVV